MKPAILLITLSFLLFAFFSTKLPSASAAEEQVVDIDDDPIFPGASAADEEMVDIDDDLIFPGDTAAEEELVDIDDNPIFLDAEEVDDINGDLTFPGDSAAERVVDTKGHPVTPRGQYYIVARGPGGGGVRPGKTRNSTHPVSVILGPGRGVPVKFTSKGIILTGTRLNVTFTRKPPGVESGKWVVVYDSKTASVGIGGPKDHPGKKLVRGVFSIQKSVFAKAYKLVFRPAKTSPPHRSFDIGRKTVDGKRLLVLTRRNPIQVVFIKATPRVDAALSSII